MDGIEYGAAADTPAAIAARELLPGERLQWAARPRPWAVARQRLTTLVGAVFLLAIGGAAIDLGSGAVLTSGGPLSALPVAGIGALFMLLGIAFAGAPLAAAWQARGTVYAVTSLRLLVIDRVFIHRVAAFAPEDIQGIMVTNERPDGSADSSARTSGTYGCAAPASASSTRSASSASPTRSACAISSGRCAAT